MSIGDLHINCLVYADDVVLMSSSKKGPQNYVNNLSQFSENWHLTVILSEIKVLVFNQSSHLKKIDINFTGQTTMCTSRYTYLGITFSASGYFTDAKHDLTLKGMK